jgi:hypothetical protein
MDVSNRSRRPPRGRAVLLWAAALFAGVQLAASAAFDYAWPQIRFPMYYEQIDRLDELERPADVVFLGSSRTACVVSEGDVAIELREQTGRIVQCFNAAVPAGDLIICERVLGDLLARGARPRFVVVEVCPEGLNRRNGWLGMYVAWVLRWDDLPAYLPDLAVTGNLVRYAGTRFIPLFVYRDQVRRQSAAAVRDWYLDLREGDAPAQGPPGAKSARRRRQQSAVARSEPSRTVVGSGDGLEEESSDEPPARPTRKRPKPSPPAPVVVLSDPNRTTIGIDGVQRALRSYQPGGNSAAALDRLLTRCRANGIEPILVTVPLSSAHRGCYTPEIDSAFLAHVAEVTYRFACRHVDYRDLVPDAAFIDHHHAAAEGAILFSTRFAREVLAPAWR